VRGHVYNDKNEKIQGAAITVKNAGWSDPDDHVWASTISSKDGSFELGFQSDSVVLSVRYLGYIPVEMKVPKDCEVDIRMEYDPVVNEFVLGPMSNSRRLRMGYILDAQRNPVYRASIVAEGEGKILGGNNTDEKNEVFSDINGLFKIRATDSAVLTINVGGYEPVVLDLKNFKNTVYMERSIRIEHEGLLIVFDYNYR
jgi:hypothetical protein